MLRVTRMAENNESITLKVEGRIVEAWVRELKRECDSCLEERDLVILDLSGVNFIDETGIRNFKRMIGNRIKLVGCSSFLSKLLNEGSLEE